MSLELAMANVQNTNPNQLMERISNIPNTNRRMLIQGTAQQIHWLLFFCKNTEGASIHVFKSSIPVSLFLYNHPVIRKVSRKSGYLPSSLMACWRVSISFLLSKGWRNQRLSVSLPKGVQVRFKNWKSDCSPNMSRSRLKGCEVSIHSFLRRKRCCHSPKKPIPLDNAGCLFHPNLSGNINGCVVLSIRERG